MAARRVIRLGVRQVIEEDRIIIIDGNPPTTPEEIEAERQSQLDIRAGHLAFWFITGGTLIWAYGDLLGRWFAPPAP